MKKTLFILFAFTLFLVNGINAQSGTNRDTLNASETVYFYPYDADTDTSANLFPRGNLYIQLRSDSLSGATNVVNEIQYSGSEPPYDWVTQTSGTLTSNGATSQTLIFEDAVFGASKWRVKSVAPSGTQATKIWTTWTFKRE